jgi:hypothetical protein
MSISQQDVSTALDALALIAAGVTGNTEDGQALLSTYTDDAEVAALALSILAHAVCLVRIASEASGVPPEKLLGAVRAGLYEVR